ncbi:arylsulfatase [Pedobacter glucosidilyticus]|nr:sulfatase [Pedobacter glucosidilyticus]KHJ39395.1 arylsulfatase [Pedobacter glucosidilyticus]
MKYLFVYVIITLISYTTIAQENASIKPNVIVILLDDAGYADFGFMGSKDLQTPEIDKLAKSGVVFTDAHTSATVCSPSRAGLITGRYQQRFGFECNGTGDSLGLDTSEITLGAALQQKGYKTIAIGKWHLGDREIYQPNARGFDEFYGFLSGSRSYFPHPKHDKPGDINAIRNNQKHVDFKEGYLTDVFGDAAIHYIDKYKKEPFFMYLSFNAVHTPMQAKKEDLEKFKNHPRQMLAAMTWALDENVGKVMKKLAAENLLENTIIFFLSDNGGAHNNQSSVYPLKGWKGNEFEGGHRVPFAMSWKGHIPAGVKSNKLVSSLDIYATALTLAQTENPSNKPIDGKSLFPHNNNDNPANQETLFWRKDEVAAARIGDYKLIRLKDNGSVLYNLKSDIGEKNNLAETEPKKYEELQKALKDWESKMRAPLWIEESDWTAITFDIHKALMKNKNPKKLQP